MRLFSPRGVAAALPFVGAALLPSASVAQETPTPSDPPQQGAPPPSQAPATPASAEPTLGQPPANLDAATGPSAPRSGLLLPPRGTPRFPGAAPTPAEAQRQNTPPDARNRVILEPDENGQGADSLTYDEVTGELVITGNVHLRYNGYRVRCDRVTYNRVTQTYTFENNVVIDTGSGEPVYADFVSVDRRTNEFRTRGGRTILAPEQVGPQVLQPLLLNGAQLLRTGRDYRATEGFLTTCDFPNPHYKIGFRQADVIVNNRLVLRDATFYRYDRKLLRIPYLVVPIRDEINYSYLPLIGRSQEEGYFVKAAVGYGLARLLPGIARIDLMEKKGVGLGFDQAYKFGENAAGTAAFYNLNDRNRGVANRNGRLNHQQYLGDTLATIQTDFQNNSYQSISANSQTGTTTLGLNRTTAQRDSILSITRSTTDYATSDSLTTTFQLAQTERFGTGNTITLRLTGSDNTNRSSFDTTDANGNPITNESTSGRVEQNGELQANARLGIFDATANANRNLRLSQKGTVAGAAFSGTQKLPDFQLRTDTTRFKGEGGLAEILRRIPATFAFGYGRFLENITRSENITNDDGTTTSRQISQGITTSRFLFDFTPREKTASLTPGGALSATFGGSFRQLMYRQDAAQYILTGNGRVTQKLGALSSLNFTYSYLRPYGAAPEEFRLDSVGSNNNIGTTLTVDTYRTRASLISGYDLASAWGDDIQTTGRRRNPWQNLSAQVSYRASDVLQTRFTAAYDINAGRLLDATNRIRLRGRGNFALDTGLRYDPRTKRFPQITEVLTLPIASRDFVLTALSSYNGVTSRFDYQQVGVSWRFHDYEYNFSYVNQPYGFRAERGFNVTIRLYALPAPQQQRSGQFGTPLDTGTGEVF